MQKLKSICGKSPHLKMCDQILITHTYISTYIIRLSLPTLYFIIIFRCGGPKTDAWSLKSDDCWWKVHRRSQYFHVFKLKCFEYCYMILHNKWLSLSFWKLNSIMLFIFRKRYWWSPNLIVILCKWHLSWKVSCVQSILIMEKSNND